MQVIELAIKDKHYPVYIGQGLLSNPDYLLRHIPDNQVVIVSNSLVVHLYGKHINFFSKHNIYADEVVLSDGEEHKSFTEAWKIFEILIEKKHRRTTTIIALGGGVITDLAAFVASNYMRGVNLIHVPTTLLGMVDAAIGGKTAINHSKAKNIIGTFYHPCAILMDVDTLVTLPDREFCSGLAEVIKYGLITDNGFFEWLEEHQDGIITRETNAIISMLKKAITIKAEHVKDDERDTKGIRALLNLGHTFGHALETLTKYTKLLHGEAVAIGLYWAAMLSQEYGLLTEFDVQRIKRLLNNLGLMTELSISLSAEQIIEQMWRDKKANSKGLRLILMERIGCAKMVDVSDRKALTHFISQLL